MALHSFSVSMAYFVFMGGSLTCAPGQIQDRQPGSVTLRNVAAAYTAGTARALSRALSPLDGWRPVACARTERGCFPFIVALHRTKKQTDSLPRPVRRASINGIEAVCFGLGLYALCMLLRGKTVAICGYERKQEAAQRRGEKTLTPSKYGILQGFWRGWGWWAIQNSNL
jgi:hypothetical protein